MARASAKKSARSSEKDEVPDVYRDLLAEASSSPSKSDYNGRSIKKRRVAGRLIAESCNDDNINNKSMVKQNDQDNVNIDDLFEDVDVRKQSIVQSESDDSADSDADWEEVKLDNGNESDAAGHLESEDSNALSLTIGNTGEIPKASKTSRRARITSTEKKLRLEVHKMQVKTRTQQLQCANISQSVLRNLLPGKTFSYLNPDKTNTQFQRSRSFMDGLDQASEVFRGRFRITARGLARPTWSDLRVLKDFRLPEDVDLPVEKADFLQASKDFEGSRDIGAQLFCGLLRSAGVDARLVCSLQPLQFRAVEKLPFPERHYAAVMQENGSRQEALPGADHPARVEQGADAQFLGGAAQLPARSKPTPKRPIRESRYPVFWVEAFNEAVQKWISIDPLITRTISKPSKLEPPSGERENNLSYVVAFEDDGSARDVTRRYAKAYNAKTRQDRVEMTKGGARWWKKVMKMFKRRQELDRDSIEDAELTAREAAEPMPRNVQDFKDHPYYALERHLRRHEVIHPKREVGKVGSAGRGHDATALESIYRRRDVLFVQSADRWYRMGSEVKKGQQPLKRVVPKKRKEASVGSEDEQGEQPGTALYASHQTNAYKAPPVTSGKIPKNAYGNLDVYVPSMIPPGGAHIQHPATVRVAKLLGIDYAEAVTGFTFKGRHGTANTNGAVIAKEHVDAVREIIIAYEDERAMLEQEKRTSEALAMWRRFLLGLRIRERIEGYDVEGERGQEDIPQKIDKAENELGNGGFLPAPDPVSIAEPTAHTRESNDEPGLSFRENGEVLEQRPPIHIPVTFGPSLDFLNENHDCSEHPKTDESAEDLFEDHSGDPKPEGFLAQQIEDGEESIQRVIAQQISEQSSARTAETNAMTVSPTQVWSSDVAEEPTQSCHTVPIEQIPIVDDGTGSAEDSRSEKGSLLSHDPEDEEEDPVDLEQMQDEVEEL